MLSHWNHLHHLLNELDLNQPARSASDLVFGARAKTDTHSWTAIDLVEHPEALHLTIDLPGLGSEDVSISVEEQTLTIRAERTRPEYGEGKLRQSGRRFGSFKRSYRLDPSLDASQSKAEVVKGVLTLEIPKHPKVQPLDIEVR